MAPVNARWFKRQFSRSLVAPWQVRSELKQFLSIVSDLRPQRILEIGRFHGETLLALARASHDRSTIISIDMTPLSRTRAALLHAFTGGRKFHLLTADSHTAETQKTVTDILDGGQLDLLFIDGDHSYAGVKQDFEMYAPFVRRDGVTAFHDIALHPPERRCEVSQFWDEIKERSRHLEIIADPHQGWAGIGVLYL